MGALSTVKMAVKLYILCTNAFLIAIVRIQSSMNFLSIAIDSYNIKIS